MPKKSIKPTAKVETRLKQVRVALENEAHRIQVVGRNLFPQETERMVALGQAVKLIDQALEILGYIDK